MKIKSPPAEMQEKETSTMNLREGQDSREARGDPARGIPTPQPPTVRESHEPRPCLEPGPCPKLPFPKEVQPAGRGVPARRRVGVPARGVLRPVRVQEAWEYHEPGPPNEPGPLAFSQKVCV